MATRALELVIPDWQCMGGYTLALIPLGNPPSLGGGVAVGEACCLPKPPLLIQGASFPGLPDLHGEGTEPYMTCLMIIRHVLWQEIERERWGAGQAGLSKKHYLRRW